jgi:hypothetical protein
MNRIFPAASKSPKRRKAIPVVCHPAQRLRRDADAILRDVAYVLALTRRVKAEILGEVSMTQSAVV